MPLKIETRGLTRVVDGRTVVRDVDLQVGRGEVVALVGPSGSGKTSLLRLLNRLDEPTGGTVLLDGTDTRSIPPTKLRRRVGLVPQAPALWEGSVLDNVLLGPRLRGQDLPEERARSLLQRIGIEDLAGREAARVSGGEAQRVALARTLANEPEVLLLDEPTANLDPGTRDEVEALVADLVRDLDLTTMLVTHYAEQAERLAGRQLHMEGGRLLVHATGGPT